ncbi:MAG: hypothetical protein KJ983_03375, partial [Candidatus Omnitrophica bacterium]|nr:hypothetical protein [Candidatus Omnitrophota bacterium]
MLNPKSKTRLFVKALSVVLIQVFFLSNVVLADAKINQSYAIESTLATYTEIPDPKFQEKVMAMEAVLMHPAENHFLKEQIKKEQSDFKAQYKSEWRKKWTEERTFIASIDDDMPEIKGLITNDVAHLKTVKIIRVNDVLKKTGQFAHVGLVEKDEEENSIPNGMPVIYVDNEYYEKVNRAVLKHEVDEIIQWEQLRFELTQIYGMNFDSTAMRSWIIDHAEKVDEKLTGECRGLTSVEISKKFHEKAFSLDDLLKEVIPSREELSKYVDFNYIKKLYALFKDEEGKDVNISASVGLATTPTMEPTYQHYKRILPPGTFGDQLVFGTSGIREIVKFLMDKKCYAIADGLIYYFTEMGEITLAEGKNLMAIAGDLRPSTDRITLMQIASAIKHGFKVINGGNIPTPAIVNYGMYSPLGAMISLMVTASHCPVLPKNIEQNGIKPNRTTGEVLKEDERRILKQVREALEIECMKPEKENMFGKLGMRKKSKLSEEQKKWLEKAREILDEVNTNPAEMYVERNELFGKIFDETDKVPFIEHMSVGRDIIKTIFDKIGINYFSEERNKKWKEKLVVDTEDVRPGLEDVVKRTVDKYAEKQIKIKGICTVDGDTDRPALFTEDGTFIYGDKTGYLTCEYICNLESMKDKKMFVAVTATVSRAVVQRLKDIGCEVAQVKIGSPYVVKAMEDRLAKAKEANEEIIVCGFERNGGFLLGSDIMLDSGKVLKALPTRDAMLPIIAAFHLAKQNNMTLGQLVDDRFSGQYASFSWSGLVQATDLGCEAYTATMGQAIMRSFSPVELDTIRIEFLEGAKILYTKKGGTKKTVTDEDKLAQRMNPIKTYLEGYFNEKRGFKDGIT